MPRETVRGEAIRGANGKTIRVLDAAVPVTVKVF